MSHFLFVIGACHKELVSQAEKKLSKSDICRDKDLEREKKKINALNAFLRLIFISIFFQIYNINVFLDHFWTSFCHSSTIVYAFVFSSSSLNYKYVPIEIDKSPYCRWQFVGNNELFVVVMTYFKNHIEATVFLRNATRHEWFAWIRYSTGELALVLMNTFIMKLQFWKNIFWTRVLKF